MADPSVDDARAEVRAFLAEQWDAELPLAEWWERLARAGFAVPTFPEADFGKGWSRVLANVVGEELRVAGAVGPPAGLGMLLAAPTIQAHGTRDQKDHYLWRILTGQDAWCQLFSEPNAGSDLAGLQCRAERDGDEFRISGQKVWTSTGQLCNLGMLIARTDPDLPKHQGITYFAFDMTQDGVEVRPLREMTGRAMFNEVFIDGARVHERDIIGGLDRGWAVANTTLAAERAGLGSGGSGAAGNAFPGPIAGHLDRPAGEFAGQVRTGGTGGGGRDMAQRLIDLARQTGANADPTVRQDLVRLWTLGRLGRYSTLRAKGGDVSPGLPNISKLMMSDMLRLNREVGNRILGAHAMVKGSDTPGGGVVQEMTLFSPGPSIYGGTDQVQKNILGERVLGLPKEPGPARDTPFRELLQNR